MKRVRQKALDLQAKIVLILVAVIVPTFVVVTFAENQFTRPILEDELRQVGITAARNLASDIVSARWLHLANPTPVIESQIQETIYSQPNIFRIDVAIKDPDGTARVIASNVEDEPGAPPSIPVLTELVTSEFKQDENGIGMWEIKVPIEQKVRDPKAPKKLLGSVHLLISTKLVGRIVGALWRTTATAAGFTVVLLVLILSYLLRKTIANDRLLRKAESANMELSAQLHDAQRQLMNLEKLAVMGQLTASFAHEIGTPLNAISGHLQLLKEDISPSSPPASSNEGVSERLTVIDGQVSKIEEIVKGFLQSTAKPASQRQLVDVNQLVDRTLGIVQPRTSSLGVEVRRRFDRDMGPLRVVPLDLEQVLLNLVNNSLDSIRAKGSSGSILEVATRLSGRQGRDWAEVSVYDTGEGIPKSDLDRVLKPFFTTKRPGEGTGLGLTICQQLLHKYGGTIEIDSKEGAWTRVTLRVPYVSA